MEIKIESHPLLKGTGETIILGHCEGATLSPLAKRFDQSCGGMIQSLFDTEEFQGKFLTHTLLRTNQKSTPRILLVGLGPARQMTVDKIRQAIGTAATTTRDAGVTDLLIPLSEFRIAGKSLSEIAQVTIEGALLALYQFNLYKTDLEKPKVIKTISLGIETSDNKNAASLGALQGRWIAEAVNNARQLCNLPGNVVTPTYLAEEAKQLSTNYPITVKIIDRTECEQLGMGAFVGVAKGTTEPPKFIVLEYTAAKGKPIALIGKSVTFDTGGISLKPAENMEQMKYDMSGGAAVLNAMRVAAQMKLPLHIVGILPATDNMPGGSAIHPGDIVTTLSGKTVEVINTDAEGRLCLADAITYALRYKPRAIIDLATLTGACVVALGAHAMALFSNHAGLQKQLEVAAEKSAERLWPMPLWDDYFSQVKSDVADLKNTGGRPGGSITAALFLKQFAKEVPWVHLDIAGVAWNGEKARPYTPKGSTGAGVRLLIQYLIAEAKQ